MTSAGFHGNQTKSKNKPTDSLKQWKLKRKTTGKARKQLLTMHRCWMKEFVVDPGYTDDSTGRQNKRNTFLVTRPYRCLHRWIRWCRCMTVSWTNCSISAFSSHNNQQPSYPPTVQLIEPPQSQTNTRWWTGLRLRQRSFFPLTSMSHGVTSEKIHELIW